MPREIDVVTAERISLGGYKELGKKISFADLAVSKSLKNNCSLTMMNKINTLISWKNIEALY